MLINGLEIQFELKSTLSSPLPPPEMQKSLSETMAELNIDFRYI